MNYVVKTIETVANAAKAISDLPGHLQFLSIIGIISLIYFGNFAYQVIDPPAPPPAPTDFNIKIIVIDQISQDRLQNIQVRVNHGNWADFTGSTDVNGITFITLPNEAQGKQGKIDVTHNGYKPYSRQINLVPNESSEDVYLELEPTAP